MQPVQLVIPLAGEGKRFSDRYSCPKPLININGETMIRLAIRTLGIPYNNSVFIIRSDHNKNGVLENQIRDISPDSKIVVIDSLTDGPCSTAMMAIPYLNPNAPLVIANCDQVMRWNGAKFLRYCQNENYDGVVVTYHETTPKNSYARINREGEVLEIREKNQISCISLNGIHYWKKASNFINSANEMIQNNDRTNGEFYIAPTYNYMISQGLRVGIFHIPNEQHFAIGTTHDLDRYMESESGEVM